MKFRPIGRRTVLRTGALALGTIATLPTVSGASPEGTTLSNTIRIEGTGSIAGYQLAVSGAIVRNGEIASLNDRTVVDGTTAMGMVGPGDDAFDYDGDIADLSIAGEANVYVNGDQVDPSSLASSEGENPRAEVRGTDQETDGTGVGGLRVEMGVGGYLSIHDVRRRLYHEDIEKNGIGSQEAINDSFIGLTDYLEPGEHHDVEVPLLGHSSWELPGDPPSGSGDRLEESQPVLAIPHIPTAPPEFQLGEDGAYTEGERTLDDLPVIHDIVTVYVEGASDDERVAAKQEEMQAREDFGG